MPELMTETFEAAMTRAVASLRRVDELNEQYRAGAVRVNVPEAFRDGDRPIDTLVEQHLPASYAALQAASRGLFFSLPVAFDPAESVGPYLAIIDRDAGGRPYRFLDMGALIATQAFGDNEPAIVRAVLESLPFVIDALRALGVPDGPVAAPQVGADADRAGRHAAPLHRQHRGGSGRERHQVGAHEPRHDVAGRGRRLHRVVRRGVPRPHAGRARRHAPQEGAPRLSDVRLAAHFVSGRGGPRSPKETARREERSLKQLWDLLVSGRLPRAEKSKDTFRREMDAIDEFLGPRSRGATGACSAFVQEQRANLTPDVVRRARRVAAVLVEPIQGEGGVRMASARFMRKLRMLTRIYDVPLVFDEVQTGWGMTGRLWAHELFDLPCPPDVVTWAKKAQNGVLFVSEELATFFQEEKKFNTTWEGDSVGMVRLLALLDKLDLEQVRRTGERARAGLEALAREHREIRQERPRRGRDAGLRRPPRGLVRGAARPRVPARPDSAGRRRAQRPLLPALRHRAVRDRRGACDPAPRRSRTCSPTACRRPPRRNRRAPASRPAWARWPSPSTRSRAWTSRRRPSRRPSVRFSRSNRNATARRPPTRRRSPDTHTRTRRSPLQFTVETLEATMANPRAIGVAVRDRVSGRLVAYALGSALENHDEEGVSSDPHFGENNTFYLQAAATLPTVQNGAEIENFLLESLRERALAAGFEFLSTLIEERLLETGPPWLRDAIVIERIDNYLGSGSTFAYLQATLK